ncbi:hypothetical protein ACIPYQ_39935 [Streptomyces sp. NPDC090045]|uniref:hypothetical protein n=1 Tax=Streptomyces sp. NPDC090045 TaxID=3365927 RepID=UPI0037F53480
MALRFVGMDPNTGGDGSPTVWVDEEKQEIVIQGWKLDPVTTDEIAGTEWVPGHHRGIPDHEIVVRIPARMIQILREACDDAERAGLRDDAEGG